VAVTSPPADFAVSLPPSSSLPLERKLPLMIFAILAVVLATSLGISYYEVRRSAVDSAGERLQNLSRAFAGAFNAQIVSRLSTMHHIAGDSTVVDALSTPNRPPKPAVARALALLYGSTDSATPPMLMTPDGRNIGAFHLEMPDDASRVLDDIHELSRNTDSLYVVGKVSATGGRASFWLSVPVWHEGDLLGYLVQERPIDMPKKAVESFRDLIGPDIEFFLRNSGNDPTWVMMSGSSASPPTKSRRFGKGLEVFTHESRGDLLASTTALPGTPLMVTVEQPIDKILERPQSTIRALLVLAAVLAGLGALLAWVFSRQVTRPLVDLTGAAEGIALGQYTERVRARRSDEIGRLAAAFNRMAEQVQRSSEASREAVQRLTRSVNTQSFLAESSEILARSLSDQTLLAELARHCTPTISDYCSIYIAEDDGTIRRVETTHHDRNKSELVRALVGRYEYRTDGPGAVSQVVRSQQPLRIKELDMRDLIRQAPDETTVKLLEQVRPSSFMCVPLVARGRAFGAMSFTYTDSGRTFTEDDLELAMELSRRTSVAIDNAVIYRRSIALRLEAEAASNAKSDFLAKMSHEIRTPINAMMGYAELLEMGISGPVTDGQSKQLARIRASGEHLTSLVNEMLDLAKIEAGRMAVDPVTAITGDVAEAALVAIRPQATAKGVEISSTPSGNPRAGYIGDPQRVQQILINLLSNAVKFTGAGGAVVVKCGNHFGRGPGTPDAEVEWACISVEDTGVGIAMEDLDRIFQPFMQVENGYTRAHGGTGLGLTISRSLAQIMGGDITVESVLGRGSRFTLWLPAPNFALA
jgi:signal transduction histidine kinase